MKQLSLSEALDAARLRKQDVSIEHIENLAVTNGIVGAKRAFSTLRLVANQITTVSVKMDGSPAIVCGPHPTSRQFIIALKDFLTSKNPRYASTHAEIDTVFANNHPETRRKLHDAFEVLHKKPLTKLIGGDILFARSSDKSLRVIGGQHHVMFKPNTIIYALPFNSPLANRVMVADFGIYWHSAYVATYDTLDSVSKTILDPLYITDIVRDPNIFSLQDNGRYESLMDPAKMRELSAMLTDLQKETDALSGNSFLELLNAHQTIQGRFIQYQNALIRGNQTLSQTSVGGFVAFLTGIHAANQRKLKSKAHKKNAVARYDDLVTAVKRASDGLARLVAWQESVTKIKLYIMSNMWYDGNGGLPRFGTYYLGKHGKFNLAGGEGYIASDNQGGYVKLVDRTEFSRHNMLRKR